MIEATIENPALPAPQARLIQHVVESAVAFNPDKDSALDYAKEELRACGFDVYRGGSHVGVHLKDEHARSALIA